MRTIRTHYFKVLLAVLALAICTGAMQAATLVGPTSAVTLTCDTVTGAVPTLVGIKLAATGSLTVTPSITTGASAMATAPSPATVASTSTAVNFSFSVASGCANATNGQQIVLTFTPNTGTALTVNATIVVTGPALVSSASTIALSCDMVAGPGSPQQVGMKLKSANSYSVTPTASPSGIVVMPVAQTITSTSSYTNFSFAVIGGCGGATNGQQIPIVFTPTNASGTGSTITVTATITVTVPTLASAQASGIGVSCDTVLGPTPATIGLTLYTGTTAYTVSSSSAAATVVVAPVGSTSVGSTSTATNWSVHGAPGCKGMVEGATVVLTFTPTSPSGGQPLPITATLHVTNSGSALALSPAAVTITCTKSGSNYSKISTANVKVTSPANYGTPFNVDTSSVSYGIANLYPYLSVTQTGASAGSTAAQLAVTTNGTCGNLPVGNTNIGVHLQNPPAADKILPVTIQVGGAAPISGTAVSLSYAKGSYTYPTVNSTLTGNDGTFFLVDTSTLPLWLTTTATSGTISGSTSLTFKPTAGAETLALGTYSANVHLKVSGYLDSIIAVTLQVKSATQTIVVAEPTPQKLQWVLGTPLPSLTLTPISTSDAPIPYTIATAATAKNLVPQVTSDSGLAYSFGPAVPITFLQAPFSAAAPGDTLSGTVTFTWTAGGGGSAIITINILVVSPAATITTVSPAALPTASGGASFTVVLTGTGFVNSVDSTLNTTVGVVSGLSLVPDGNITPTVVNDTTIALHITVPATADPFLPFSGSGGSLTIGVCNPGVGTPCYTPTSQKVIAIGINPIVQAVTSASSYMQATPPLLTAVAPYDIISIFGTNFCVSNATGCTSPSPLILYGATDPNSLGYQSWLSPDSTGATQRKLTVTFQTHGSSPTSIANAPLLFATNGQINLLVPEAVQAYFGNTVDIVVNFGYNSGATMLSSAPFSVTIAPTDPGIFAMGGTGQGDAAALLADYSLVGQTNPAGVQGSNGTSDTIQLYITGLGVPDSDDSGSGYSATCMATGTYFAAVNAAAVANQVAGFTTLATDDGLVLQSTLYPSGQIQPCVKATSPNVPTVSVGNIQAEVDFAGWVSGSVAGLYQLNVKLPPLNSSFTDASGSVTVAAAPVKLPIVVTSNTVTSQPIGVNLWVVARLTVTATEVDIVKSTVIDTALASPFTVTSGTGTGQQFSVPDLTQMPTGLVLGSDGTITGTAPSATGTYTINVSVIDDGGFTGTTPLTIKITN
ncbi:MAG: putative Ig domain-containing protein [Candidatus Sulfopaludibacter sp.]|nr:putative Ig domain-containing protein [Candidatus Sulfopaludibacter sp.]